MENRVQSQFQASVNDSKVLGKSDSLLVCIKQQNKQTYERVIRYESFHFNLNTGWSHKH